MDITLQIKSLLNEAELYRSQGLFPEAEEKFRAAATIIEKLDRLKNKTRLLASIKDKIARVASKYQQAESGVAAPELSEKGQNLIKNLFGESDFQKALALAKFGQFDRAVEDFTALLEDETYRLEAAKNILRCRVSTDMLDQAIEHYTSWSTQDLFGTRQMEVLRAYLQPILDHKGIDHALPTPPADQSDNQGGVISADIEFNTMDNPEEILDITSVGIPLSNGTQPSQMVEFDVNFQSGDMLSLIIPKSRKNLLEELNTEERLEDVQFFSPIALFTGTAVVANKTEIKVGPKRGDHCLDLKIVAT